MAGRTRPTLGLTRPPIQSVLRYLSPGVKRQGGEADKTLPPSAEVKKGCSTCTSLIRLPGVTLNWKIHWSIWLLWLLTSQSLLWLSYLTYQAYHCSSGWDCYQRTRVFASADTSSYLKLSAFTIYHLPHTHSVNVTLLQRLINLYYLVKRNPISYEANHYAVLISFCCFLPIKSTQS
jgi:hypothetical protein